MKREGKRARAKREYQEFVREFQRLAEGRYIKCECGAEFLPQTIQPPRFPGVVGCYGCGKEHPVKPGGALYVNLIAMTVQVA